jgi:hypothetical protein
MDCSLQVLTKQSKQEAPVAYGHTSTVFCRTCSLGATGTRHAVLLATIGHPFTSLRGTSAWPRALVMSRRRTSAGSPALLTWLPSCTRGCRCQGHFKMSMNALQVAETCRKYVGEMEVRYILRSCFIHIGDAHLMAGDAVCDLTGLCSHSDSDNTLSGKKGSRCQKGPESK